jgi:radical SAM protein with 4Fe4S-binding SPASM domain
MMRVSGDGKLFPCAQFFKLRSEEFVIADLNKVRFKDAMYSNRYKEVVSRIQNLNVRTECMTNCKENSINEFLWNLTNNKPEHINFV